MKSVKEALKGRTGKIMGTVLFGAVLMAVWSVQAEANMDNQKLYKEAFPGTKPKCIFCHVEKLPKKADGAHDLNDYGFQVKGDGADVTVESLQAVGEVPAE